MTLAQLRTAMVAAATGTDIVEVYFDYNKVLDETLVKQYPLILWDIDNAAGTKNLRKLTPGQTLTLNVFVGNVILPDADKIPAWDAVIADLDEYLLSLAEQASVKPNLDEFEFELFPAGFLSVEREIAVRYRIELELWC